MAELLGELSFGGYRELGFDRVLLVEGVNDVKTIQQFLRHRGKDHKVLIVPLGGSAMINGDRADELQELSRMDANVSAIIDSEKTAASVALSPERQAFVANCNQSGINCLVLARRAVENYLIRKGDPSFTLAEFERLDQQWPKHEGWKIARDMSADALAGTDLGSFLDGL